MKTPQWLGLGALAFVAYEVVAYHINKGRVDSNINKGTALPLLPLDLYGQYFGWSPTTPAVIAGSSDNAQVINAPLLAPGQSL